MARKRRSEDDDDFDDEEDERPRRKRRRDDDEPIRRRKKSSINPGLLIALAVGGVLFVVLIGGCVLWQLAGRGAAGGGGEGGGIFGVGDSDKVTPGKVGHDIDNPSYSTPQGIERVLGPGQSVPQSQWGTMLKHQGSSPEERTLGGWLGYSAGKSMPLVFRWSSKEEDLYVAFWPPGGGGAMAPKRTMVMYYHEAGQKTRVITQSGYSN